MGQRRDDDQDPFAAGFHGVWYLYVSYTYDGGATWYTVQADPNPVQRGEIDAGGTTTSGQRNLLDFMDASLTKDGRVLVAYADGCLDTCNGPNGTEAQSTNQYATVAYQGYAGGVDPEIIRELNVRATGGVLPDLTLLFDCDPSVGFRRRGGRRRDHFERQALGFHRKVRRGYREIQRAEPKRVRLIDAARPADEVAAEVQAIVGEFLRGA